MCGLVESLLRRESEESSSGGRESNMQYLAILHILALSLPAEELGREDGVPTALSFLFTVHTVAHWNEERDDVLRAMMRTRKVTERDRGYCKDKRRFFRKELPHLLWFFSPSSTSI